MMSFKKYQKSQEALENGQLVKGIVGAASEDPKEIERSAYIFTKARYHIIDVRAGPDEIRAAKRGVNRASAQMDNDPGTLICGSWTVPGDIHSQKANINEMRCINCGVCKNHCPNNAIYEENSCTVLDETRCRGCGHCEEMCSSNAILLRPMDADSINEAVNQCIKAGADAMEFHISGLPVEQVELILDEIKEILPVGFLSSFCIGSMESSPKEINSLTRTIKTKREGQLTVIQADGATMGGRPGSFQGLAIAEQVLSVLGSSSSIYVIVSGSATELTWQLIEASRLEVAGIGIGIRARELIGDALTVNDFDNNDEIVEKAISRAIILHRPADHKNNSGKIVKTYKMGPAVKRALA